MDKYIDELTTVAEQIGNTKDGIKDKVEELEEKVNGLQKELANLLQYISNAPKNALRSTVKEQPIQVQAAPANSILSLFQRGLRFCVAYSGKTFNN